MRTIALLHNDRDRRAVEAVYRQLVPRLGRHDCEPWMASMNMTAFGDIFQQIETSISGAVGSVLFLGRHGLGAFQRHIERPLVDVELWLQGQQYGRVLVHLEPNLTVPRYMMSWPMVYHTGPKTDAELADAIAMLFGLG